MSYFRIQIILVMALLMLGDLTFASKKDLELLKFLMDQKISPLKNKCTSFSETDEKRTIKWLHGVNSIPALQEAIKEYRGIELDIVFSNEGKMEIYHPPNPPSGLFLQDYIASLPTVSNLYFWLDFKNLNDKNQQQALKILSKYFPATSRSHVIVESKKPDLLEPFENSGFLTSFYLPNLKISDRDKTIEQIRAARKMIEKTETNFVSFDIKYYHIYKWLFPYCNALVWGIGNNLDNLPRNILGDIYIKVFLREK